MRLDWFLPALRKSSDGTPRRQTLLTRWARRIAPPGWTSNHATKQRGAVRRLLGKLGTSWLHSPLRRLSQTLCFAIFLWLFFHVCWPYSASPAAPSQTSANWELRDFDQRTGQIQLIGETVPDWVVADSDLQLIDARTNTALGTFAISHIGDASLELRPTRLDAELLNRVMLASGDWTIADRAPNAWPSHYADELAAKEKLPADLFLVIDPLVSISTAIASRQWVWSLACAAIILVVCVMVPRGFCGYICPLGTLIDLFDASIGKRVTWLRVSQDGWWVHLKYYLLLASLLCAAFGVLVTGYVAAIPVITRGMLFLGEPLQSGTLRGWHLVPTMTGAALLSIGMFLSVLCLGLLQPRFWCKYVCPSGAVFSVGNLFRATERKVESSCIHCNKCIEVCPFDAIKPDFTTRVTDCTQCQTCGGVCPTHAIKFVERGNVVELKLENDPPTGETPWGRRGFLSAAVGTAASIAGATALTMSTKTFGANLRSAPEWLPVRPPGSVPEREFLTMCIRCGECFKACPNNVLQPLAFQQGLEGLWTPHVVADWAGCESSCNACGQVCPTGAIRALPLEEKRYAKMGLAIVNEQTCLPFANRAACQLCVDECNAAGYEAIEFTQVHTKVDEQGNPVAESGYLAPVVIADKCVGCGLCQTRCFGINGEEKQLLKRSAIVIRAGDGRDDRQLTGSYRPGPTAPSASHPAPALEQRVIPPEPVSEPISEDDDPFGLN